MQWYYYTTWLLLLLVIILVFLSDHILDSLSELIEPAPVCWEWRDIGWLAAEASCLADSVQNVIKYVLWSDKKPWEPEINSEIWGKTQWTHNS